MNQQPDKFFRDKLQGYQQEAPPNAWNRVSQHANKRKRIVWLRYAASILVVAACGIAMFPMLTEAPNEPVAQTNPAAENTVPTQHDTTTPEEPQTKPGTSVEERHETLAGASVPKKPTTRTTPRKKSSPCNDVERQSERMIVTEETTTAATGAISESVAVNDVVAHKAEEPSLPVEESVENTRPKSVTIVFTADEVKKKYLQKNREAEATADAKTSSGLRKLLDKASDLTTNQDLLGDLRQKKNEILAMNFKSEKQRSEND